MPVSDQNLFLRMGSFVPCLLLVASAFFRGEEAAALLAICYARPRAALAGAMLMGIASQRYILKMPDLKDADVEDILRLITPLLATLLTRTTVETEG